MAAGQQPRIARIIRVLALPIVLGWAALTVLTNVLVPSLEEVGEEHTVGLSARDAPAMISMQRIGANFIDNRSIFANPIRECLAAEIRPGVAMRFKQQPGCSPRICGQIKARLRCEER